MNYIFLCHQSNVAPDRFYTKAHLTRVFNYRSRLDNAGKWKNIHRWLSGQESFHSGDLFWFPDPDLLFDEKMPDQLFENAALWELDLCQPAVTSDSVCSHPHLFSKPDTFEPRPAPFCEIMCPLFSYDALKRNLWTFDLNYSGFGIDLLWGTKEKCHVLDWLTVRHPSSPGYHNTAKAAGFPDPNRELEEVKRLYL